MHYHAVMHPSRALLLGTCLLALAQLQCARPYDYASAGNPNVQLVLHPAGFVSQQAYPNNEVVLKIMALNSAGANIQNSNDLLPASSTPVVWSFVGTPPIGATLGTPTTQTDAQGVSQIAVNVGTMQNITLQVQATSGSATPVVFTVQVQANLQQLSAVGSSPARVSAGRLSQVGVRLTRPASGGAVGAGLGGVTLTAMLANMGNSDATLANAANGVVTLVTDATGLASVTLNSGTVLSADYSIAFCVSGCDGIAPLLIPVLVNPPGNGVTCVDFTDCSNGNYCNAGVCVAMVGNCDVSADCQTGYACDSNSRTCMLQPGPACRADTDCAAGFVCSNGHCVPTTGCQTDANCTGGWLCNRASGACVQPPNVPALDVSGTWYTTYYFDIQNALPGFFTGGMKPVVDFLNMSFSNQLTINIPILGPILQAVIKDLVAQYIPPSVNNATAALTDMLHAFDSMQINGTMQLTQSPNTPVLGNQLSGQETWTDAHFTLVSLCKGGLAQYKQTPSCGDVDIILSPNLVMAGSSANATATVHVSNFYGAVNGNTVTLQNRQSEVALQQTVNIMLNVIANAISNGQYNNFASYISTVIPCDQLQTQINTTACTDTGGKVCTIPGVQTLCPNLCEGGL